MVVWVRMFSLLLAVQHVNAYIVRAVNNVCVRACVCLYACRDKIALAAFSTQQIRIRGALIVGIRSRDPIDL